MSVHVTMPKWMSRSVQVLVLAGVLESVRPPVLALTHAAILSTLQRLHVGDGLRDVGRRGILEGVVEAPRVQQRREEPGLQPPSTR